MAVLSSIAIAASLVRSLDTGLFLISGKPLLPVAAAADNIQLLTIPNDMRLLGTHLRVPNDLGAGVTLKLQRNRGGVRIDIGLVTTAATAGVVLGTGLLPVDLLAGDIIEVLTAGGASAAKVIEYDLTVQRA